MYCINCGEKNDDGAKVCSACQYNFKENIFVREGSAEEQLPGKSASHIENTILVLGIVGTILAILGFPIIALVMTAVALSKAKKHKDELSPTSSIADLGKTFSLVGLIISICSLAPMVISLLLLIVYFVVILIICILGIIFTLCAGMSQMAVFFPLVF